MEPVVPLDCDPYLLHMLMRVTMELARIDYASWQLGVAMKVPGVPKVYAPLPIIDESKELMARFDWDAVADLLGQVEQADQAAKRREVLSVIHGGV